jgi:hypothetical protein
MRQRLSILSLAGIALLALVFGGASIARAENPGIVLEGAPAIESIFLAHTTHNWVYQTIFAIVDTGNDSTHRIDGIQRCTIGGETRTMSTYASHSYQFIWYSYNQYSSTQHQYKRDDRCTACAHVKHTTQLQSHQCESIYDTQCGLCGYTNTRMCG